MPSDDKPTVAQIELMYRHMTSEMEALRKLIRSALPEGSAERHLIEHEITKQARLDAEKRRAELISHVTRTLVIAAVLMLAKWTYNGGIAHLTADMQKQSGATK